MMFNDFEIILSLFKTHSINQTAREQGYSQSAVSAILQKVESEFEIKIFQRSHRGIEPTSSGALFQNYIANLVVDNQVFRDQLLKNRKKKTTLISSVLFNFLVRSREISSLTTNQFDIASTIEIKNNINYQYDEIITYKGILGNDFYKAVKTAVIPSHFAYSYNAVSDDNSLPFIVNADVTCPFREKTYSYNNDQQANKNQVLEIDSWSGILSVITLGQGKALLPDYMIKENDLDILPNSQLINIEFEYFKK